MAMDTNTEATHRVGTREEWPAARLALLQAGKAMTQPSSAGPGGASTCEAGRTP